MAANRWLRNPIIEKVHVLRGKRFLIEAQNREGAEPGWGKFFRSPNEGMRTAYALLGLQAVKAEQSAAFRRGMHALKKEQLRDGGWGDDEGSNVEGTAWAIVSLTRSSRNSTSQLIDSGMSYLLNTRVEAGSAWPERQGGPPLVWCTHHAILALNSYLDSIHTKEAAC